ncbi:MAG TPA: glycosyltransferase family 2 protein [Actinomycetales bacterium]|nr:glycosyltransferase family 2 protein [Actinomycetales bacterium]
MTTSANGLAPLPEHAGVSVVMPVLNEERHLAEAVRAVLDQRYDGPVQVALALGPSRDRTDEVAEALAAADPRVVLVANPSGRTPEALNAAIAATQHPVVVRVDGHSVLDPDYVAVAVALLRRTGAANVGGIMDAEGSTPWEQAVAAAMTSVLGVGSAPFHVGGAEGPVDTVYLGVFRREWLERVGGYDPEFVRAQDWEMNHRIRALGGLVWFSPRLRVSYRPRSTVRALARQYRDYGRWRRVVARTHPGTINPRYLAPPMALLGVTGGTALGVAAAVTGRRTLAWGMILPAGYAAVVAAGTVFAGRGLPRRAALRLPVVLPTMHLSWGWGFLTSPASIVPRRSETPTAEEEVRLTGR